MCGIAGFISKDLSSQTNNISWIKDIAKKLSSVTTGADAVEELSALISILRENFTELMSLATHQALASSSDLKKDVDFIISAFKKHENTLVELSKAGRTDLDPVIEGLRDFGWQLNKELIGHVKRVAELAGENPEGTAVGVAFATEHVMNAIDRLEVRGRDSAGITIQFPIPTKKIETLPSKLAQEIQERLTSSNVDHLSITMTTIADKSSFGFVYKTANLIGRLGENGAELRRAITEDKLFWLLATFATQVSVLAHTRWASSGIISLSNCHPHNASLNTKQSSHAEVSSMFVLNGDIDNHVELAKKLDSNGPKDSESAITTDAKIIPIVHRHTKESAGSNFDNFRATIRQLDGSMAIGMIDLNQPGETYLAQKGSGQGLYAANLVDGWMFASEVYGLASVTRSAFNLSSNVQGGSVARLDAQLKKPEVRSVTDGVGVSVAPDDIQIFARDIYRGNFDFFLEKEIHEAPSSVAKTLRGRYRHAEGGIKFDGLPSDIWKMLRKRLKSDLRWIYVIGQGTAGVAGVGIAHLIERAFSNKMRHAITVRALRSSELSVEIDESTFENAIVIAVSQSGTTTDTNRAVDLARERGAFVHAIVNRRNSDLVRKSDSVIYTSDGRDVEMSVASTKAFYSQITAGKLTALFIADALDTMTQLEIQHEMVELEALPGKIQEVLEMKEQIAECAHSYAPNARYWAVTGSGINHIAALEIRIKLSELCYKSIPVDFTEDKKHIDLSTEPMTLVIANDLKPEVVGDVVKEIAIFKAHNGRPIVICTQGPDSQAFATYAERVIALPKVSTDLAFALAAVAGHMFSFYAAQAVDEGAQSLKKIMLSLGDIIKSKSANDVSISLDTFADFLNCAAKGGYDSGLGARHIAKISLSASAMSTAHKNSDISTCINIAKELLTPLQTTIDETSRPIDTIRHQAKTVTVGTSRPDDALSPVVRDAIANIGILESGISTDDRKTLSLISRLVDQVIWGAELKIQKNEAQKLLQLIGIPPPSNALERYNQETNPVGLIGAVIDENRVKIGRLGDVEAIVIPVRNENSPEASTIIFLSIKMLNYASREQKLTVLKSLGIFKKKLREWEAYHNAEVEKELIKEIADKDPTTLFFDPNSLNPAHVSVLI
ncbi:MAG: SIS domain-containing protein [Magnetococcales bacterium]|nr:SIS domain-containing protein [Magnetococcales bacterium]